MAKLVCQSGPSAGHEYPIEKDKTLFGRQRTCDVQVLDSMASREHFLIRRDGNLYTLVDLESRNGTVLNRRKVSERQLDFGDRIKIGEVEYLFVKEDGDLEIQDLLTKKYQVLDKIGEGGMGIVYKAIQRSMDRVVALKILSPKFASRQRFVEQFTREARAAGALNHSNIIQVHDVGSENGIHYLSMEYIDGVTCMEMLKTEGPLPVPAALEVIRQTAKALEYAHQHHIIHRDIKPDNIMIGTDNAVKLADLGISKTFEEAEAEGNPKRVIGTPHYMSPEAALGKPIDHRIDIYSLGATFYHILAGRTPYSGTTATDILKGHIKDTLTPICQVNPDITPRVGDLISRMMAKNPDERIQTAAEVVAEISDIQNKALNQGVIVAGADTRILQNLSRSARTAINGPGTPARGGDQPATSTPAEADYTDRVTGEEEGEAARGRRRGSELTLARNIIIGIICVLGAIILFMLFHFLADDGGPGDPGAGGGTAVTGNDRTNVGPNYGTQPPVNTNLAVTRQLDGLSQRIMNAADETAIDQISLEIKGIAITGLNPEQLQRITDLLDRAAGRRSDLKLERLRNRYNTLSARTQELCERFEHTTAIAELTAARSEFDGKYLERLDELIAEKQRALDEEIESVEGACRRLKAGHDLAGLKKLLAGLPAPLASGKIGETIGAAIKEVEEHQRTREVEAIKEMVNLAKRWNFAEFAIVHAQRLPLLSTPALRQQADELYQVLGRLQTAVPQVHAGIRSFGIAARFHGTIGLFTDPLMIGADEAGIILKVETGSITVLWKEIPIETLTQILTQVLGGKATEMISQVQRLQTLTTE